MAKAPRNAPAVVEELPVTEFEPPAELMDQFEEDSGRGVSFKQEDQLIPLIYVLQSNSPIVDERGEAYVEGAKPGHFWLRNSLHPIADGEEGLEVIPCGMQRTWIEWLPNRQGFVMRHNERPFDTEERTMRGDDGRERTMLVRAGNGNILQDTREFYVLVNAPSMECQPFVFPCSGTKHTFARQWQSWFHKFHHPKTKSILPSFARKYLLTTVPVSNALGKWFGLKFQDRGYVNTEQYFAARSFNESFEKGEKKPEAPITGEEHKDDDIPFE